MGLFDKLKTIFSIDLSKLKKLDIKGTVWYSEVKFDAGVSAHTKNTFKLQEIPVFPEVSRDLSLVLNKEILYSEIETIVIRTVGKYLQKITLFDVFEGKPLPEGKKSSFCPDRVLNTFILFVSFQHT